MESFFSRYRNALVLITVLLAQVIGLAVQVRRPGPNPGDKGGVRLIRSWVVGLVTPPERLLHATGSGIRGVWTNYFDLIHVRQQNRNLQAQLGQMQLEEDSLAEDARQGQRLQALLGFREKYIYKTVAAQVIGTSGTEQSEVLLIDKGSRDGIKPDMPVITPDGIVGKTRDVFARTSQVLEISDPTSGAGVMMENTRIRGVLRGDSWGQPEIVNVSPDERIRRGEPVITSGGDAIYPRGLAVGAVDRVVPDPDGTLVSVLITPAANLSKLDEVLVITSTGSKMPIQMQQDLSDAEQKASEILAERLPSRQDPNAPPQQPGSTAPSSSTALTGIVPPPPQPPPPLHPDRYSSVDVPPAADMVPGQRIANVPSAAPMSDGEGAAKAAEVKTPAEKQTKPEKPEVKKPEAGEEGDHPVRIEPPGRTPATKEKKLEPTPTPDGTPAAGTPAESGTPPQGAA
jgi:rod shape-determining protein MreC